MRAEARGLNACGTALLGGPRLPLRRVDGQNRTAHRWDAADTDTRAAERFVHKNTRPPKCAPCTPAPPQVHNPLIAQPVSVSRVELDPDWMRAADAELAQCVEDLPPGAGLTRV